MFVKSPVILWRRLVWAAIVGVFLRARMLITFKRYCFLSENGRADTTEGMANADVDLCVGFVSRQCLSSHDYAFMVFLEDVITDALIYRKSQGEGCDRFLSGGCLCWGYA